MRPGLFRWSTRSRKPLPNTSLDASGGSVFLNLNDPAQGALMRAAASTPPLGCLLIGWRLTSANRNSLFVNVCGRNGSNLKHVTSKYGQPMSETYSVRPDIKVTVTYAKNG